MLRLLIGNRNYSSWSMRPWVLMRQLGIEFEDTVVRFDSFDDDSAFKATLRAHGGDGRVPLLLDGDFAVWDSTAIAEYLYETHPGVWPAEPRRRARARSVCGEMHSGFAALRQHCPMNIEADLAQAGRRVWDERADVRADLRRIERIWSDALRDSGGPMLFGEFSYADACFAPVCMRVLGYGLPLGDTAREYLQRVCALQAVTQWVAQARAEHDFLAFNEPYRQAPRA